MLCCTLTVLWLDSEGHCYAAAGTAGSSTPAEQSRLMRISHSSISFPLCQWIMQLFSRGKVLVSICKVLTLSSSFTSLFTTCPEVTAAVSVHRETLHLLTYIPHALFQAFVQFFIEFQNTGIQPKAKTILLLLYLCKQKCNKYTTGYHRL